MIYLQCNGSEGAQTKQKMPRGFSIPPSAHAPMKNTFAKAAKKTVNDKNLKKKKKIGE